MHPRWNATTITITTWTRVCWSFGSQRLVGRTNVSEEYAASIFKAQLLTSWYPRNPHGVTTNTDISTASASISSNRNTFETWSYRSGTELFWTLTFLLTAPLSDFNSPFLGRGEMERHFLWPKAQTTITRSNVIRVWVQQEPLHLSRLDLVIAERCSKFT